MKDFRPEALDAFRAMLAIETGEPEYSTMPNEELAALADRMFPHVEWGPTFWAEVLDACAPWLAEAKRAERAECAECACGRCGEPMDATRWLCAPCVDAVTHEERARTAGVAP